MSGFVEIAAARRALDGRLPHGLSELRGRRSLRPAISWTVIDA